MTSPDDKTAEAADASTGGAKPTPVPDGSAGIVPDRPAGTWGPPTPIGYYTALQSAGGIAAPLLAGFSFTMTSVLLVSPRVCRWQNATLALFVSTGLILIFAVQTSLWLQSHAVKPSDYEEWYPDSLIGGYPKAKAFAWHQEDSDKASTYAKATRRLYNLGILLLFAGVTTAVLPPGPVSNQRYIVVGVGACGFIAELTWILTSSTR